MSAVRGKNTSNVAWDAFVPDDDAQHELTLEAQPLLGFDPSFITGSTNGRLLTIDRDDHLGPIGTGFVCRRGMSKEDFLEEQDEHLANDFYPVCVQALRTGQRPEYAAIFVNNEKIVARKETTKGGPEVPAIDQAVFKLMKLSNIPRGPRWRW